MEWGLGAALRPSPESDDFLRRARETFVDIGAFGLVAAVDRLTGPGDRGSAPPRPDEDRGEVRPSSRVAGS